MADIKGKTAIVTGGANGIGKTIAEAFAKSGCKVAILDRDDAAGAEAERELSSFGEVRYYHCDVSSVEEIKTTFAKIAADFEGVDILINNAGIPIRDRIEDIDEETWDRFTAINAKSVFFFSQIFAEHIKKRASGYGRIINLSTVRTKVYDVTHAGYTITKSTVNAITKSFAISYGQYGITANAIAPAFVLTPMTEHYLADPKAQEVIKTVSPIGRGVEQNEIADLALFIATPGNEGVNGQIIYMDGGGLCSPGVFA